MAKGRTVTMFTGAPTRTSTRSGRGQVRLPSRASVSSRFSQTSARTRGPRAEPPRTMPLDNYRLCYCLAADQATRLCWPRVGTAGHRLCDTPSIRRDSLPANMDRRRNQDPTTHDFGSCYDTSINPPISKTWSQNQAIARKIQRRWALPGVVTRGGAA